MKSERAYYVYIMSNNAGITYVGVTNDLFRRVNEHKTGALPGFSRKHKTHRLVYYEEFQYIEDAINREKQIKAYRKEKKRDLIKSINPKWMDLSAEWHVDETYLLQSSFFISPSTPACASR